MSVEDGMKRGLPGHDEKVTEDAPFLDHLRASFDKGMPDAESDLQFGSTSPDRKIADTGSVSNLVLEASLMSPLNERGLPPKPPTIAGHNRRVSWGQETQIEASHGRQKSVSKLSLEDVLGNGPFEEEAETNILKIIDERQQSISHLGRNRSDSGASSILSHVPSNSVHSFDDAASLGVEKLPHDHSDEGSTREDRPEDITSRSKSPGGWEQHKPLIERPPAHHRVMSVEQSLFNLTEAMANLHGEGDDRSEDSNNQRLNHRRTRTSTAEDFAMNVVQLAEHEGKTLAVPVRNNIEQLDTVTEGDSGGESNSDSNPDIEHGVPHSNSDLGNTDQARRNKRSRRKSMLAQTNGKFKHDWEIWTDFFRPRKEIFLSYLKVVLFYLLVPLTGIAAILFYLAGNPVAAHPTNPASISWILLFCSRQIITFSMAFAFQGFLIDFIALGTRVMLRLMGPILTLFIVQSKGWPFVVFWWTIFDFAMLAFDRPFAHHWLFWQDAIKMFSEQNLSGEVVMNEWYIRVLKIGVSVSLIVAVKRFIIGLYLGRQTFSHYGQQLASVMNKMLLISEVAGLANEIESLFSSRQDYVGDESPRESRLMTSQEGLKGIDFLREDDESTASNMVPEKVQVIDTSRRDPLTGSLHYSEKLKLMQLLEQWEEPEIRDGNSNDIASISAVLRFRKAITFIQKRYPFSHAFGPADTRESCIESAQDVYNRLRMHKDTEMLQFETIAMLALDVNGNINQHKAKDLIKIFRPDRQGNLSVLDFVKSVDSVYKEFRLLNASIDNSSQIDRAFENIFNSVFYFVIAAVVLSQCGIDPLALFLSLSSVILAFAFMIGSASAKYFEGVLFILVRRPYGIGDLIQVGGVETNGSLDGALPWMVVNVSLFETVVVYLPTNERASLSNGSLASSRIINWARSPQAQFHIFLNFPLDTPYEKIVVFKRAIEEYMKARPREWRALNGFRANRVYANQNYVEYIIVIQHREPWQHVGQVLDSKANLSSYCQEVAKQLGMHYQAPRLPVELTYSKAEPTETDKTMNDEMDGDKLALEFNTMARNKHNIRVC